MRMVCFCGIVLLTVVTTAQGRQSREGFRISGVRAMLCVLMIAQLAAPPVLPIFQLPPTLLRFLALVLFVVGLAVTVSARLALGPDLSRPGPPRLLPNQRLISSGPFAHVHHPMYAGELALLAGLQLAMNSWPGLLAPVLTYWVIRRASVEEAGLHGTLPGCQAYAARTKRFIPRLY